MATNRAKQLEKLAMSMPQANQQAAAGQQAARQVQLQEQVRQVQPGQGGPQLAQQMGAQQAAQSGAIQTQTAQKGQQQAQLVGQMGLEEKARDQRQAGFEQGIALTQNQREISNKLSKLDKELKNNLLDAQLDFRKDESGRTLFNERQLADWAISKAESAEEYAEYAQAVQQVHERDMQILETAHKKISRAIEQGYIQKGKMLDRSSTKKLIQQKNTIEAKMQEKANKAANKAAMWQAGGTIIGAVAGSFIPGAGTAVGAAAGAALGGGLGSIAGNL